jgi:hypothetical protein
LGLPETDRRKGFEKAGIESSNTARGDATNAANSGKCEHRRNPAFMSQNTRNLFAEITLQD